MRYPLPYAYARFVKLKERRVAALWDAFAGTSGTIAAFGASATGTASHGPRGWPSSSARPPSSASTVAATVAAVRSAGGDAPADGGGDAREAPRVHPRPC